MSLITKIKALPKDRKVSLIIGIFSCGKLDKQDMQVLNAIKDIKLNKKDEAVLWNLVSRSQNKDILSYSTYFLHK